MSRLRPDQDDVRVIVGDTHGDHVNLLALLRKIGAIDDQGVRQPGFWLCHVGDVIHAGHGVQADDLLCLNHVLELFDCVLYGNHETPFAFGLGKFAGMNDHLDCQSLLNRSVYEGRWQVATSVDGHLICHGGLHPGLLRGDDVRAFRALRRRDLLDDPDAVADAINDAFERRVRRREPEPLFDWCSALRGGRNVYGGVFWCDWRELMAAEDKTPSPVAQIVGHTPRRNVQIAMDGKFICVDVGAALSGYVGAVVKRPGQDAWTAVRAGPGRPARELAAWQP